MRFSRRIQQMDTSVLRELLALTAKPDIISFAGGLPAPESFPVEALRMASDRVYRLCGRTALQYSPSAGLPSLREKLAQRHRSQGIACTAENFLIISGSQQGLDLAGKVFLEPGDLVLCENPTYMAALNVFRSYECTVMPVETDNEGIIPRNLEEKLAQNPDAKLLYVIPTFQNPTGRQWSLARRRAVLDIAQRYGLPVLEDDPYGALRYEGEPLLSLKSMDSSGIVTYMGSFSKVLSPGIRLGWLLASQELIERYTSAKECSDLQSSTIAQMTVDAYLESNDLDAHVSEITALYSQRRDRMLSALSDLFPAGASWTHPQGGLFLWVTLPDWMDSAALLPEMVSRGVAYIPGRDFFANRDIRNCLRLNFSNSSEEQIAEGLRIMAQALQRVM